MAVVYVATTRFAEDQLRTAITAELQTLQDEFHRGELAELRALIEARSAHSTPSAFAYLLQDVRGRRLAGSLPPTEPFEGWRTLGAPEDGDAQGESTGGERLLGNGIVLPDGNFLLVAHDVDQLWELQELLLRSFELTIAIAVPLALAGGVLMSFATLRRIEAINRVSAEIRRGDLSRRVPRSGTDDELDRLGANINAMLDAIQELTEGLRQVSNDIAHDLRTPLTRLRQELETTRLKARRPAELAAAVDHAISQTDAILEIFGALLRIAQIEAGTRRAGFTRLDLSELFQSLVEIYTPVAEDAEHRLEARIESAISYIGDGELLTQMLANLIENAVRHTPPGTRIDVTLERSGGAARGMVADSGPGIPSDAREKVFRRFFRLEASRSSPGSGLGLSLAAAIAALHGIRVELADNAPGLRIDLWFAAASAPL